MSLAEGASKALTATVVPEGTAVEWQSSDEGVATVDGGMVTAVGAGRANVTASITVEGTKYSAKCAVTVSGGVRWRA